MDRALLDGPDLAVDRGAVGAAGAGPAEGEAPVRTRPWPPLWFLTHPEQPGEPFCDCEEEGNCAHKLYVARGEAKSLTEGTGIAHGLVRYVAAVPQRKARR